MAETNPLQSPSFLEAVKRITAELEALPPEERAEARRRFQEEITPAQDTGHQPPVVPIRFERARLDTYKPVTESQGLALQQAMRFVQRVTKRKAPMIAQVGIQGAGKSHLLYGVVWDLWEKHRIRAYHASWPVLADWLRGGRPGAPGKPSITKEEVRAELYSARIILLDEVTPTANTPFDDTELKKLASHCYDNAIAIMLNSNTDPLSDVMGAAAADRFEQLTVVGPTRQER